MTSGNSPDQAVLIAASEFLHHPLERHTREGNLQSDVEALLRAIGVGSLESHYSTVDGEADIYLPNRRTFIELKAYPLAADPDKPQQGRSSESPRAQLDRYVIGEINRELGRIPPDSDEFMRSNWMGIVTDGRHWHVYEYGHRLQSVGVSVDSPRLFMNESLPLAEFLHSLLGERSFGKEWIPSDPGSLFTSLKDELVDLYSSLPSRAIRSTRTKKELWLDMMRTSGMVPADEAGKDRLFVIHSFLISVVRLVSHSLFPASSDQDWKPTLQDGFTAWVLDFERGKKWAEKLYRLVSAYDWRRREEDVLRSLYHHNVDPHDRKVFGEFYTPDWLAALMVEEILDDDWMEYAINSAVVAIRQHKPVEGIGVLDPTCGSGTFLLHAARRLLGADSIQSFPPVQKADIVSLLVNGIDIHPVAVELARVNLERILPAPPSMGHHSFQVHLGDSLQADSTVQETLFSHTENLMKVSTPEGRALLIPMSFVRRTSFANDMRDMVNSATKNNPLPDFLTAFMTDEEAILLRECHAKLTEIIAEEGNSVWTWYTINIAAPHLLSLRKVDRIVANPPWVKLADIQVRYRKETMEQYGISLGLKPEGKQAPHPDIASYFILSSRNLYLASPESNPACWLVKKSAIASGQWEPFRAVHQDSLRQSVDLEQLQPFGGGDATRSCLLMENSTMARFDNSGNNRLEARLKTKGYRPDPTEALASASRKFNFVAAPDPLPQALSDYFSPQGKGIRQGATLVPHVLSNLDEVEDPDYDNLVKVTTRRSTKSVWKKIKPQTGKIPSNWVQPVLTSIQMVTYIPSIRATRAIIPLYRKGRLYRTPREACSFWSELDEIYDTNAPIGKGTPKTLLERIDYQSALSDQLSIDPDLKWMVLYPSSGDIMRASREKSGTKIVDSTLYWLAVRTEDEAGYLVAILNAACLRRAFKESRDSGRHFHLHPWRKVPIPRYDETNTKHQRLAELCADAERLALKAARKKLEKKPNTGQVGISMAIRNALYLAEVGQEIEAIVTDLFPEQVTVENI